MNNRWVTPGNPLKGHAAGPSPEWLRQAEVERAMAEDDGTKLKERNGSGLAARVRGALGKLLPSRRRKG